MSSQLISSDVVPIGGGYVILMAALAVGLRLQRKGPPGQRNPRESSPGESPPGKSPPGESPPGKSPRETARPAGHDADVPAPGRLASRLAPGWPRFATQVATTAIGGYVLLMAVLVAFYYGVSRVAGHFLQSGFTGCAMLLALALPVFAIASRAAELRRRRSGRSGQAGRSGHAGRSGQAGPAGQSGRE
jgi:Family of unknown function (DUF6256)